MESILYAKIMSILLAANMHIAPQPVKTLDQYTRNDGSSVIMITTPRHCVSGDMKTPVECD